MSWNETDSKRLEAIKLALDSIASSQVKLLDKVEEITSRLRRIESGDMKITIRQDKR